MKKDNYYIYFHIRLDTMAVFYIGKGNRDRAKSKHRRNKHWNNIANKHGYDIQYPFTGLTEKQAFDKEVELINLYKRTCDGGVLCNMTVGGEGISGHTHSQETKDIISAARTGVVSPLLGIKRSDEVIERAAKGNRGLKRSEQGKVNMSIAQTGKCLSKETRLKMSKSRTGSLHFRAKRILDVSSGLYYDTLTNASTAVGIPHQTLSKYLRGINPNKTSLIYV